MKWRVRPTRCNKLWFINNPLAQHVSGTIMPIFRSAGPISLSQFLVVHDGAELFALGSIMQAKLDCQPISTFDLIW